MTHYRLRESNPSAIITVNGSESKIYDNNVIYLNNGENFQLRFFNPLQERIGVEINFNGKKTSNSLLILRPGEDVTLERFLNESRKMVFETYKIDSNNPDAVKAAQLNGLIDIKFYKEEVPTWNNNYFYSNSNNWNYDGTTTRGIGTSTISFDSLSDSQSFNFSMNNFSGYLKSCKSRSKSIDTGRVEKGEQSNQQLESVDVKFQTYAFHTVSYQLKPNSEKTQYANEIRQYCICKYRIRNNNWKFCPKCGRDL